MRTLCYFSGRSDPEEADEEARADLRSLARSYNRQMVADRGFDTEAQVLEAIRTLSVQGDSRLSVREITDLFIQRHGDEYDRKVTPKWIGYLLRCKLNLTTHKSDGVFVIPPSEQPRLLRLYERYGLVSADQPATPPLQSP